MRFLPALVMGLLVLAGCLAQQDVQQAGNGTLQAGDLSKEIPKAVEDSAAGLETGTKESAAPPANSTQNIAVGDEPAGFDFENTTTGDGSLIVHYFHSSGCGACLALDPEIDRLEKDYPDVLFLRYDLVTQNGTDAYLAFADLYNLSRDQRLVPQVLVNGTIVTDRFNINDSLEGMIEGFRQA